MKRQTLMLLIAVALIAMTAFGGNAYADASAPQAKSTTATCAKFADSNNDGVCDSSAVCHKDGKCVGCKDCPNFKDANNDGKCDATVCAQHAQHAAPGKAAAAATACPSLKNGTCKKTGKACPSQR